MKNKSKRKRNFIINHFLVKAKSHERIDLLITTSVNIYQTKKMPMVMKTCFSEGNIIILHMSTMNENHMMYDSWDMERDRQICLLLYHLLPFYAPLLPHHHLTQKIKILKKSKKHQEIHHFTHEYHKWQSHDIWPLRYEVQ